MDNRELVARIIDPLAWHRGYEEPWLHFKEGEQEAWLQRMRTPSLQQADAVLAALPENMGLSDITHSQAGFTVSVYTFNNSPVVHESGHNRSVQTWREYEGTGDTWTDALKNAIAAALKEDE